MQIQGSGIRFIDGIQTVAQSLDAQSALSGHRELGAGWSQAGDCSLEVM